MAEIDLRGNYLWSGGFPREEQLVAREAYRLMCVFAASPELSRRRGDDETSAYGSAMQEFEYVEISRILISLAAILRNQWDLDRARTADFIGTATANQSVGVLIPDMKAPTKTKPLTIRESFNKIVHANLVNLDRSKAGSITSGHLEPFVHLYGEYGDKEWKATIDIFSWVEVVHWLS